MRKILMPVLLSASLVHCGPPPENESSEESVLVGRALPIQHVVVIVKENHTFDNYFGSFPGADGISTCLTESGSVSCPHAPDSTSRDLCHSHSCALADWNAGAMNGWAQVAGSSQNGDHL